MNTFMNWAVGIAATIFFGAILYCAFAKIPRVPVSHCKCECCNH